jgi:hypothetical protein
MNVTGAMPVEYGLCHSFLTIGNAGRNQDATTRYARFVHAGLVFRDACIYKRAYESTCRGAYPGANEGGSQGGAERSRYCDRPNAGYRDSAYANQEAGEATQNSTAYCSCHSATGAAGIYVHLCCIGFSRAHRNADIVSSDAAISKVLYGSLCLRGILEQTYYCCHNFMSS